MNDEIEWKEKLGMKTILDQTGTWMDFMLNKERGAWKVEDH